MKIYLSLLLILLIPSLTFGNNTAVGGPERDYYVRIDLEQWKITAYDLNRVEDLILNGVPSEEAIQQSIISDRLIVAKNSKVYLQVFSMDVQHGVSIAELGIQKTIESRDWSVYTFPVYISFQTPTIDNVFEISCHVYCGIGHSDMKLKLQIGEGKKEYGSAVLLIAVVVNTIIFTSTALILKLKKVPALD